MDRRLHAALFGFAVLGALLPSCVFSRRVDTSQCDAVVTRCQTVCDTWCDDWGCYPDCYDSCWDDCVIDPSLRSPPATPVEGGAPSSDAGAPSSDAGAPSSDAGAPSPGDASGTLCSACASNEACGAGGLCVTRGGGSDGGDAGLGFCAQPCRGTASSSDCPSGYVCNAIGSSMQCLPASGTCP